MPTYEFECQECGKIEEVFQKIDAPAPVCHDQAMKRLISGAPAIRKGAGIYSLDTVSPGDYSMGWHKETKDD